jgi:hypothetical protein
MGLPKGQPPVHKLTRSENKRGGRNGAVARRGLPGTCGPHILWHVKRGIFKASCIYCLAQKESS